MLDKGRIVEQGTHEELLRTRRRVRALPRHAVARQEPATDAASDDDGETVPRAGRLDARRAAAERAAGAGHADHRRAARSSGSAAAATPRWSSAQHCTMDGVQFAVGAEGVRRDRRLLLLHQRGAALRAVAAHRQLRGDRLERDDRRHRLPPDCAGASASPTPSPARRSARAGHVRRSRDGAVVIEDDVWIGPNATILKGVRIGAGSLHRARRAGHQGRAAAVARRLATRRRSIGTRMTGMTADRTLPWDWYRRARSRTMSPSTTTAYVETTFSFLLFRSERRRTRVTIGRGASTYLGTMFDVGREGRGHVRRLRARPRRAHHLRRGGDDRRLRPHLAGTSC